jgi:hypothetical protein
MVKKNTKPQTISFFWASKPVRAALKRASKRIALRFRKQRYIRQPQIRMACSNITFLIYWVNVHWHRS